MMRFFNISTMKKMADNVKFAAICSIPPAVLYSEIQDEKKAAEDFRKRYPNARVYFKPRVIAGMGGACDVIAEDKETGEIIARR